MVVHDTYESKMSKTASHCCIFETYMSSFEEVGEQKEQSRRGKEQIKQLKIEKCGNGLNRHFKLGYVAVNTGTV